MRATGRLVGRAGEMLVAPAATPPLGDDHPLSGHGKIGGRTFIAKPVEAQRVIRVIEDQLASSRTP